MKEILDVIGIPKVVYHDHEGSWNSTQFIRLLNPHKIRQIVTSSPPPCAERTVQTLKQMIHTRLEGLDMTEETWIDMLKPVLKKYNATKHSTTGVSPYDVERKDNQIEVWLNIRNKATFARKHPLQVGESVRTYIKPHTFKKGCQPSWSKEVYRITFIRNSQYLINEVFRAEYITLSHRLMYDDCILHNRFQISLYSILYNIGDGRKLLY
jgi:hypothetical protein